MTSVVDSYSVLKMTLSKAFTTDMWAFRVERGIVWRPLTKPEGAALLAHAEKHASFPWAGKARAKKLKHLQ